MSNMKVLMTMIEEEYPAEKEELVELLCRYFDGEALWGELPKEVQDFILKSKKEATNG